MLLNSKELVFDAEKTGVYDVTKEQAHTGRLLLITHCALLIVALILLWPVMRHPGWWLWTPRAEHSDLAVTHWPNAHFTRWALWADGGFPLWRPTIMSGTPFAANPLAGLYYPPNWILLFLPWLPLELGFNLSALVHLWLAGAAMYALLRRGFDTGVWGALVASVIYEASPKLLAHLGAGHVGWVQAWGWLPLVMLCVMQLLKKIEGQEGEGIEARKFTIYVGVALAMQFCADVRMTAYTLVAVMAFVVLRLLRWVGKGREDRDVGLCNLQFVIFSLLIFLGLSACQWLPAVALLSETTRALMTLRDAALWSLPWKYLAGLLLANHGGFHEWTTYVGVGALMLAGVGAGSVWRRRGERWLLAWLVGLLAGAAWFSLGENGGLFQLLWRFVPGLGLLRVPPRAWVLVVFAVAVLAGLGVEETQRRGGRATRGQTLLLAVGVFPPSLVLGYWLSVGVPPLNLVMFGIVTPLTAMICHRRPPRPARVAIRDPRWLGVAAVLLVAVDLLIVDATLIEARSPEKVFAGGRAAAEWLSAQLPTPYSSVRIYSPSYSIPQHVAELYGLELADGVDPLQLRVYADYLTRAAGMEPQGYSVTLPPFLTEDDIRVALKDIVPDAEMLAMLRVRYVAAAFPIAGREWQFVGQFGEVYVYENRRARPLPEMDDGSSIVLADGVTLFQYRSWPVYVGWVLSGVMVLALFSIKMTEKFILGRISQ